MKQQYIECGKVCNAHGVRGFLKVEPWCDSPKVLLAQKRIFLAAGDGKYEERAILSASGAAGFVLLHIAGIDSREEAIACKNRILYLDRADIPLAAGAVLLADLIGLPVIDADTKEVLGEITDVDDAPAGRLYTVKTPKGIRLLPAVPAFIKETDPERGVFVTPIPGLFDGDDI